MTLGLKKAGFKVIGAVDFNRQACLTYRKNHPNVHLIERDIRYVSPDEFDNYTSRRLDLLAICAPCQPFSNQNRKKRTDDIRIDLLSESLPFVAHFLPRIVFIENVPGLEANGVFSNFVAELKSLGYDVSMPIRVNAAELGVPQRRARVVVIATTDVPLSRAIQVRKKRPRTVRQTIGDLPPPPIGKPAATDDPLHFARKHSDLNIRRLLHIPVDGGGRESLPIALQLACHKGKKSTSFSDTYGRMKWGDVSPTLTTGCTDITRGRFAHPEQHRAITLREAARLQSFPDSYQFLGNSGEIATQIGNAVPPRMMTTIASGLYKILSEKISNEL